MYIIVMVRNLIKLLNYSELNISYSLKYLPWQLATDWTVRLLNPDGSEIFRTRLDWFWGPLSLGKMGTGSVSRE